MPDAAEVAALREEVARLLEQAARLQAAIDQFAPGQGDVAPSIVPPAPTYLTVKQAAAVATDLAGRTISDSSVRRWCIDFKVGHQMPSGSWLVDQARLRDHVLARAEDRS